ncbi:unnamed protein product, partial [Oppiella nova]
YDDSAHNLGRYCGNKIPPDFLSTGEALLLRFRTDDTIHNKGFAVSYSALDANEDEQIIPVEKPQKHRTALPVYRHRHRHMRRHN